LGTIRLKGGDEYHGEWMNGIKHGKGVYMFNNGDSYEG
jgi:hypothetical protein